MCPRRLNIDVKLLRDALRYASLPIIRQDEEGVRFAEAVMLRVKP